MKPFALLLCLIGNISVVFCQPTMSRKKNKVYTQLESLIETIDSSEAVTDLKHNENLSFIEDAKKNGFCSIPQERILSAVEAYKEYKVAYYVRELIDFEISELKFFEYPKDFNLQIQNLKEKRDILDKQLNLIVDNKYLHYNIQETSKQWAKSIHIFHDNDFLMIPSKRNADRDYTGGFRIEFTTDLLKMRLFKYFGNSKVFLSYQSILIGGEGYTPYIRFTPNELLNRGIFYEIDPETNFLTAPSLDSVQNYLRSNQQLADRPFASFQYIGRGKYRLHQSGIFRIESLFKIGKVGGEVGENIQAVIHQDITPGSQRVLNWENQIANGGRLAINIEHKMDVSVFSSKSLLSAATSEKNIRPALKSLMANTNIYIPVELAFGTVQTHVGTGIGISNKSFEDISGINDVKLVNFKGLKWLEKIWLNTFVNFEYNYRRVIHNSMLEGIGFTNPFDDDPLDNEAVTMYTLRDQDIQRNLHSIKWQIGVRVNKMSIYYRQVRYLNKEFEVEGVTPNYEEFATQAWYGFGRIGLNFLL